MNRRGLLQSTGVVALAPWLVGFGVTIPRSIVGTTMGTFFKIDFEDSVEGVLFERLKREVRSLLDQTESRMSLYKKESELSRFNSVKNMQWQPISPETARIISTALTIGKQSLGAFNCAVGAVSRQWGFGPVPVTDENLMKQISSDMTLRPGAVELSHDNCYLRKKDIYSEVDLNAIAKGDAVDQLTAVLAQYGLARYLIEIGGEFYGSVEQDSSDPWIIGITHPEGGIVDRIHLSGKGIATSGDYIHERRLRKRRLTHLIDPNSGEPIDSTLALVSVIADTTMQADAWATALQVMGLEKGMLFAKQNNMASFFMNRESGGYVGYATKEFNHHRVMTHRGTKWLPC